MRQEREKTRRETIKMMRRILKREVLDPENNNENWDKYDCLSRERFSRRIGGRNQ